MEERFKLNHQGEKTRKITKEVGVEFFKEKLRDPTTSGYYFLDITKQHYQNCCLYAFARMFHFEKDEKHLENMTSNCDSNYLKYRISN